MRNILLEPWTGPFGGVPPLDAVRIEDIEPAIDAAMAEARAEIAAITDNDAPATFANTIEALERHGALLDRVGAIYYLWAANMADADFREVEARVEPKLTAFRSELLLNEALFGRVKAVWEDKTALAALPADAQRLVEDRYTDFVRKGAALSPETKDRIAEIETALSPLYTAFGQNMLHDEETIVTTLTGDEMAGVPGDMRAAAAALAKEHGQTGVFAIANTRSAVEPFLTYADDRAAREKVWRAFTTRGEVTAAHDNRPLIAEILRLRHERSTLQGYQSFAHRALEKQVAKTPKAAMALMQTVWKAALQKVEVELADMMPLAEAAGQTTPIAPWDYLYYAEKVRAERFDVDADEVKQYLQLEKLREGMFFMAASLYGLEFKAAPDVPVFHPDVRVWSVERVGEPIGLWYFDPFARKGKRSGAWMTAYRSQSKLMGGQTPIVSNNANFIKPDADSPVLISWNDAVTLFHEFGHALHGLLSDVTYPSQSGTSVPRDYVEFPSQVHENWLLTDEILSQFAVHVETGKPLPRALADKLRAASTFNQGYATVEYLACALLDMQLHMAAPAADFSVETFEAEALAALDMPSAIGMRHRLPHFAHIFSGEGYAAGYYAYLWADTFAADGWAAFEEANDPFDQATASRFYDHVLSRGDTVDPTEGYRAFRGRDVTIDALLKQRGLAA